jgi:Uma2 family endonuclease
MAITPKLMTADELADLPDDGMRHELVRGELRTMPPPGFPHGRLADDVGDSLRGHVKAQQLGRVFTSEIGYLLTSDPETVRVPDVAFLSRARLQEAGDVPGFFPGSPDLVVEVISPNDRYGDVDQKIAESLEHGARLVFEVNPRRKTVDVHRPGQPIRVLSVNDVLDGEDVVPGWSMAVRDLFE